MRYISVRACQCVNDLLAMSRQVCLWSRRVTIRGNSKSLSAIVVLPSPKIRQKKYATGELLPLGQHAS
jgi:hypothetical protein